MLDASDKVALRSDAATAAIIASWRRLTGGRSVRDTQRRTLVAVSGGCDSSALLLALASASENLVVGHVVHDFRPAVESLRDRDVAAALAARVGVAFAETSVAAREEGGNLEAASRRLRYAALARMAQDHACGFIATAHHADDLLETVLMRLLRGTGPAGLAPLRESRRLDGITIVRPMLGVTREDAERVCGLVSHHWAADATNADHRRLRNHLRTSVVPELRRLSPLVAQKVAVTSQLVGEAAGVVRGRARWLLKRAQHEGSGWTWDRPRLAGESRVVLGDLLRLCAAALNEGNGLDRLSHRVLTGAVAAIQDSSTERREFVWGSVRVVVHAGFVQIGPTPT